jgi:hypothetical protein
MTPMDRLPLGGSGVRIRAVGSQFPEICQRQMCYREYVSVDISHLEGRNPRFLKKML